jgi:hypothetical protein
VAARPPDPEEKIAYDEDFVIDTLRESGLEPVRVEHGFWADRLPEECLTH